MTLTKRCACPAQPCEHAWNYVFKIKGQRYRGTTNTNVHRVALDVARAARVTAIKKAAGLMADTTPAIKLSALVKKYDAFVLAEHPASAAKDIRVVHAFRDSLDGDPALDTITSWQITKFQSERVGATDTRSDGRKGRARARSTVERDMHAIRGLFRQAVVWADDTGLTVNPCAPKTRGDKSSGVAKLKFDERKIRTATAAELALLKTAPRVVRVLCELTVTSLGRLMELATLRPVDLDTVANRITVRRKGGKAQALPVTAAQMAELSAMVVDADQPFVLFGDAVPSQQALTNTIRRWWIGRGVRGVSHHTMRHTGVTLMLDAGVNNRVIQKLAGWSSLRMLERYGHAPDAEVARAVAVTSAALNPGRKTPQTAAGEDARRRTTPRASSTGRRAARSGKAAR